jgi:hypothetical protein
VVAHQEPRFGKEHLNFCNTIIYHYQK